MTERLLSSVALANVRSHYISAQWTTTDCVECCRQLCTDAQWTAVGNWI